MTTKPSACPQCAAPWPNGVTCKDHFHQFLYWEAEDPSILVVHHLMVLSYHLQHPSLYSPQALSGAIAMLDDFLKTGVSTQEMRRRGRDRVDSGQRTWKIAGTPESHGSYDPPIQWTMWAHDVVAGGLDNYVSRINAWALSIHQSLQAGGLLPR